jgi:hypothetical protein
MAGKFQSKVTRGIIRRFHRGDRGSVDAVARRRFSLALRITLDEELLADPYTVGKTNFDEP